MLEAAAEVEYISAVLAGEEEVAGGAKYAGIDDEVLEWIRDELDTIAVEEGTHAALAWRTIEWICSIDHDACDAVNEQVLNKAVLEAAFERRFVAHDGASSTMETMKSIWDQISVRDEAQNHNPTEDTDGGSLGCASLALNFTSVVVQEDSCT